MRNFFFTTIVLMLVCVLTIGCQSDNDSSNDTVTVASATTKTLYPVVNQKAEVTFTASTDWRATCSAGWLTVSPAEGKAGSHTITVTTTQINRTKDVRSAVVTITAGSAQGSVTIRQSGEYGEFEEDVYEIGAEGGSVALTFITNVDDFSRLTIAYSQSNDTWIHWPSESRSRSGELFRGKTSALVVDPNEGRDPRAAIYVLGLTTDDGNWVGLDTCYVQQAGVSTGYHSTDYSADGTVSVLQRASQGKGINVVLMGDGFADKDINDGTYQMVMEKAMENLFSEEPVKSMRNYFTVYSVAAVSANDYVGEGYSTVFSCVPDRQSTHIEADKDMVMEYVRKIEDIDSLNTLAVVILHTNVYNGVTYLYSNGKGEPVQYAAAFCPVIENLESESFRTVLVHEAIGHGLAKLADEYGYKENGAPTADEINKIKNLYHKYGWMKNIDTTGDVSSIDWRDFIGDHRFSNEDIGAYEGGYTYTTGIYRPTLESMMNSNDSPFNAPSRKIIYDRVRQLGEGKATSAFSEFAAFDEQHKPEQWVYSTRSHAAAHVGKRLARPVMLTRNW